MKFMYNMALLLAMSASGAYAMAQNPTPEELALEKIKAAEGLSYLNLSELNLITLPPEIGTLTELIVLNLSDNLLTELPPEIGQLKKLREIYLSNNRLRRLPDEFGQLTDLRVMNANGNQYIPELPATVAHLKHLEELYLNDNLLTSVSAPGRGIWCLKPCVLVLD